MDRKMDKVLELFYEFPSRKFTIREIAKIVKIPKSTVQNYLTLIKSNNLVTKENQASNSALYKIKKINYSIEKLYASGLIEYLKDSLSPSCIILFGSFRKGEFVKDSDIDIFIETTTKTELNLKKFENKLNHKINIRKEINIHNLQPRLFNNIINGIKLEGFFKVK